MVFLVLSMILALFIGRYPIFENTNWKSPESLLWKLVLNIRLPRVLLAVVSGFGLAVAGLITQIIFRNPLADTGILGINQAAGFGAALAILLIDNHFPYVQILSFLCAISALLITIIISKRIQNNKILSLVLAGIAVSALFSSGLGLLKYLADPVEQLPSIVFWLLGSLSSANWSVLLRTSILVIPLLTFLFFYRWRLNLHSLDQDVSFSLGLRDHREMFLVLIASVLLTSTIISFSGIIGWIGLIIPNFSRVILKVNSQRILVYSMLLGAIYLLICDTFSRSLLPGEIPLGIFTALIGSVLFMGIMFLKRFRI